MVKKKKKKIDKRTWMIRIVAMGCALLMLATVIMPLFSHFNKLKGSVQF